MVKFLKSRRQKNYRSIEHSEKYFVSVKKDNIAVYAMQLLSIADLKRMIDLIDSGNIVLVSLNPLKRKNREKANEFLKRVIEYTKSANANILLIGNEYLAISPKRISINKIESYSANKEMDKPDAEREIGTNGDKI